ncbi:MAG: glycoside hydrolase family 2 protein, partial [Lachnospiraceae bacterium]|nr:glycoside hydrolase family 2 protein [Lachnospiraceae bacterium]
MRKSFLLNNDWKFAKNDTLISTYPSDWESVNLPHTWNNIDGQDGGNDYYRGTTQYVKKFNTADCKVSDREELYLEFKGVAMSASVYVNQKLVAEHKGGYSTFRANITDAVVDGENILAVLVNNEENTTVYP